jgi:hypothetical protein
MGFALILCIVSWTQAFEAIMNESCIYQPTQVVWIFHHVAPSLVLKTVGILCRVPRAFEAFVDSNQNLAQFVELRVLPRHDQFLVSWPCGIELQVT